MGGRFSVWSSISLPAFINSNFDCYLELLEGARLADKHTKDASWESNIPVMMALLGVWNTNSLNINNHGIFTYNFRLRSLTKYISQLSMESNGKSINFESKENLEFADQSMEAISYYAIKASSVLSKERGSYSSYKNSKWDRQIFPLDSIKILEDERGQKINVDRNTTLDWDTLKSFVKRHGMRNSNVMAIAPTATIANISGVFPCTEPAYKNMYMKENLSGNFMVMNRFLIDDLESLNLWNEQTIKQIKFHNGSLKDIIEVPENLKVKTLSPMTAPEKNKPLFYFCMERWDIWETFFKEYPRSINELDFLFAKNLHGRFYSNKMNIPEKKFYI